MIRRESAGGYCLITQNDHALLAGRLVRLVGNERFARIAADGPVARAIDLHDCGWPLHDDAPTVNWLGQPLDVFEAPRQIALQAWQASAERAEGEDSYAGLLVSLHVLALSAYTATSSPVQAIRPEPAPGEQFALNKFQHQHIERQERLRRQLGLPDDHPLNLGLPAPGLSPEEDQLLFDLRLLQAMDLLSLCLCCTRPPAEQSLEVFPGPGCEPLRLRMWLDSSQGLRVDPWPFATPYLDVQVPCRTVAARAYTAQQLRAALAAAAPEMLRLTLAAGGSGP